MVCRTRDRDALPRARVEGAGRLAAIEGPLTNDTLTYTYDELGRQKTRSLNGVTTTWTYDTLGRLQSEVDPIGTFTLAYDGVSGRLQQLAYPNGQTSTYAYLGNAGERRLQEIHHKTGGGATLSRFAYAYSPAGNITTWTQQYGANVKAYDFTYDSTNQLTGAVHRTTDVTPVVQKRYGYAYDRAGNRTEARADETPVTFAYNRMNQLASSAGTLDFIGTTNEPASVTVAGQPAASTGASAFRRSVALPGGTSTVAVTATDASGNTRTQSYEVDVAASPETFTYDANGNLTTQGTKSYEWDAENRLTRVLDSGAEIARFVYDGYGRRVQKITPSTTRSYVYDGMDLLQERIGTGTTNVTRTIPGPGIDEPLASVDAAGAVSYYLADHLGSIVQQTNAAGAVTLIRQYDPYGLPLQGGSTSGYAFTGQQWDAETQLYYYRARYYSPSLGRFVSSDPAGIGGGINLYGYVGNQTTGARDPLGLQSGAQALPWISGGSGAAGAIWALAGTVGSTIVEAVVSTPVGVAVGLAGGVGALIGRGIGHIPTGGGRTVDDAVTDFWVSVVFATPPDYAYNPNGPKAPGKPGPETGFRDPKGGDRWSKPPNSNAKGWEDAAGTVWVPTGPPEHPNSHGGSHWDVTDRYGNFLGSRYPGGFCRP